jgi:hypothetical protein
LVLVPWQLAQSPVAGWAASLTMKVPAVAPGRVWKPVYWLPDVNVVGLIGYFDIDIQAYGDSWQAWQLDVMPE